MVIDRWMRDSAYHRARAIIAVTLKISIAGMMSRWSESS